MYYKYYRMNRVKLLSLAAVLAAAAVVLCGGQTWASMDIEMSPGAASHLVYEQALQFDHTLPETLTAQNVKFSDNLVYADFNSNDIKQAVCSLTAGLFSNPLITRSAGSVQERHSSLYTSKTSTLNSVRLE